MTFELLSEHLSVFLQHILAGCKETPSLSTHSAVILERIDSRSLNKSSFLDSSSIDFEEKPASVSSLESKADLNSKISSLSSTPSLKNQPKDVSYTLKLLRCCYCCWRTFLGVFRYCCRFPSRYQSLACSLRLTMRREVKVQRKERMSAKFPLLLPHPPFPCCRPEPWRRPATSSASRRSSKRRPRSDSQNHFSDQTHVFLIHSLIGLGFEDLHVFFSFQKCIPWVSIVQSDINKSMVAILCVSQLLFIWTVNSAQVQY